MRRLLVLGGTDLANSLVEELRQARPDVSIVLSLAGRTRNPELPDCDVRAGGFGGAEGLAAFLRTDEIAAVIDATHPYAAQISANATKAAASAAVPCLHLVRPPWEAVPGDNWHPVPDHAAAADRLEKLSRTRRLSAFLSVGRQELAPYRDLPNCDLVVRSVEPPDSADLPPGARLVLARGPFAEADETAFLRENGIDVLVSKNSGGTATYGKIAAARALGLPVVMVARPAALEGKVVGTVGQALEWVSLNAI